MYDYSRFNNVFDTITIEYNSIIGTIRGIGGKVSDFTAYCIPTELIPSPNPYDIHGRIVCSYTQPVVTLTKINRHTVIADEHLVIRPAITVVLTYVGIINP